MTSDKRAFRSSEGAMAVVLTAVVAAMGLYWMQLRPIQKEIAAVRESSAALAYPADDAVLARQREELEQQATRLRGEFAALQLSVGEMLRRFPAEDKAANTQSLAISNLARRCGLKVHESTYPYKPDSEGGGFSAAFLARYPDLRECKRPLVKLKAQAPYDGIRNFTQGLLELTPHVTVARFQIERAPREADAKTKLLENEPAAALIITLLLVL